MVSKMQMALPLSALRMTIFQFLDNAIMSFKESLEMFSFFLDREGCDREDLF